MYLIEEYSPKTLNEFIMNPFLNRLLNSIIATDDIQILLMGDYSCGKTTLINLIIGQYYQLKMSNRTVQNNIYKINSLNEQGITSFRPNLKTFCQTNSLINGKKKVVIIDDMDNLNNQNQQILRNCIDKYRNKVHFIFTCNNLQKILDNIQSRVTILNIPNLTKEQLFDYFNSILINKHIIIDKSNIELIIRISNYNMNSIFNNLQKLILLNREITTDDIMHNCTTINFDIFNKFIVEIDNNNYKNATNILYSLFDNGYSVNDILENFFEYVKFNEDLLLEKRYKYFNIICKYITYFYTIHEDKCELFLFVREIIKC